MEKKFKPNKKVIIFSCVLLCIVVISVFFYKKSHKTTATQVNILQAKNKKLIESTTVNGNIESNYRNDIILNPAIKINKVFVKEGQSVKKGTVLVQLDTKDLKSQLDKQKINLQNANTTLNQLQGDSVANEKKNAQNSISKGNITLQNAKSNYADLNKKFQQAKVLFEKGYMSQNDYDAAKKALADSQNAIKSAEIGIQNSKDMLTKIDTTTKDRVEVQRNQITLIQSDIKSLNEKIEDGNIRANVGGKIVKMDAKEGQNPKTGDLIVIDDESKYKVSLDLSQYDAVKVKKGMNAKIKVKGLDKEYTGKVSEIGQMAVTKPNMQGGSATEEYKTNVKVYLDDKDEDIKSGYEAECEIIFNEKESGLGVSFDAIKEENGTKKKYIYVVGSDNRAKKVYITTGLETEYDVEVLSGLKEGDKYISNPPEKIKDGETVEKSNG